MTQQDIRLAIRGLLGAELWAKFGGLGYRAMAEVPKLKKWRSELLQAADDDEAEREPTAQGLARYPETGGRYRDVACTCVNSCPRVCKGACGCAACREAYVEWDGQGRIDGP